MTLWILPSEFKNTSYVKVKPSLTILNTKNIINLNTSYVKVKPTAEMSTKEDSTFKYISC